VDQPWRDRVWEGSGASLEEERREKGLLKPIVVQHLVWVDNILQGELVVSHASNAAAFIPLVGSQKRPGQQILTGPSNSDSLCRD